MKILETTLEGFIFKMRECNFIYRRAQSAFLHVNFLVWLRLKVLCEIPQLMVHIIYHIHFDYFFTSCQFLFFNKYNVTKNIKPLSKMINVLHTVCMGDG